MRSFDTPRDRAHALPASRGYRGGMGRTDSASRVIDASLERLYAALTDPEALAEWLPPNGMTGAFEWFDATPGGGYRMRLTYRGAGTGKTTSDSDVVNARFVELQLPRRVVQEVQFVSDDPALAGTM